VSWAVRLRCGVDVVAFISKSDADLLDEVVLADVERRAVEEVPETP
jgi:hypothetical protein